MENEERKMAYFAEEKERKMRLRAEREAGQSRRHRSSVLKLKSLNKL